jgi:dihydropteroate synthase
MAQIMGVLNVTPDSFSDGGSYLDVEAAVARAQIMVDEGATVIDVGGESTRPSATEVDPATEIERVVPVITALAANFAGSDVRISIDTRNEETAHRALGAGASILNDVSASIGAVAADHGAGWVCMHMRGTPATMQDNPQYESVVDEVLEYLTAAAESARQAGVEEIWIDPGIGFGKSHEDNLKLLGNIDKLVDSGWPVVLGVSRKRSLGLVTAASDRAAELRIGSRMQDPSRPTLEDGREAASMVPPDDRLEAGLAAAGWAIAHGVQIIRTHDVAPTARLIAAHHDLRLTPLSPAFATAGNLS